MKFYNKISGFITSLAPWGPITSMSSLEEAQQYLDIYFQNWLAVADDFAEDLEILRTRKINEVNLVCKQQIVSGIYSDALEERHKYDSSIEDQLNCVQAYAVARFSGAPVLYRIWDTNDITKNWYYHTSEQFEKVMYDGSIAMGNLLFRCSQYKIALANATSIEEINNIMSSVTWS